MAKKRMTRKNAAEVLVKLDAIAKKDPRGAPEIVSALTDAACRMICEGVSPLQAVNEALDELRDEDFFGTEGQLDPRGDGREEA